MLAVEWIGEYNPRFHRGSEAQFMAAGHSTAKKDGQFKSGLIFLGKFLRHGRRIGSVWPSSRALSVATLKYVDWNHAKVIVELGAGTGPITQAIVDRLQPQTKFLAIERDGDFAHILCNRFANHPNVEIVHGDVRDTDTILEDRNIAEVDYFISGLATPALPKSIQKRMFVAVRKYLSPHGVFSNITEVPLYYRRYYRALFGNVNFQFVPINIPPGGVYHCRAMRSEKPERHKKRAASHAHSS